MKHLFIPYRSPKQLEFRRTPGGGLKQVYWIENDFEEWHLSHDAIKCGYYSITTEEEITLNETAPGWRKSLAWNLAVLKFKKRYAL